MSYPMIPVARNPTSVDRASQLHPGPALRAITCSDGKYRCPYHFHDPTAFPECASQRFENRGRLGQHIREKHLECHFICYKCGHGSGSKRYKDRHSAKACKRMMAEAKRDGTFDQLQDRIQTLEAFSVLSWDMVANGHHQRSDLMENFDQLYIRLFGSCIVLHGMFLIPSDIMYEEESAINMSADCCPKMRTSDVIFKNNFAPTAPLPRRSTALVPPQPTDTVVDLRPAIDTSANYPRFLAPSFSWNSVQSSSPATGPYGIGPPSSFGLSGAQIYAESIFDFPSGQPATDSTNISMHGDAHVQYNSSFIGIASSAPTELAHTGGMGGMDPGRNIDREIVNVRGRLYAPFSMQNGHPMEVVSGRPSAMWAMREFDAGFTPFDGGVQYSRPPILWGTLTVDPQELYRPWQ